MVTFEPSSNDECDRADINGQAIGPSGHTISITGTRCRLDGYCIHTLVLTSVRDGVEMQVDEADAKVVSDHMRLRKYILVKSARTLSAVLIEDLHQSDD